MPNNLESVVKPTQELVEKVQPKYESIELAVLIEEIVRKQINILETINCKRKIREPDIENAKKAVERAILTAKIMQPPKIQDLRVDSKLIFFIEEHHHLDRPRPDHQRAHVFFNSRIWIITQLHKSKGTLTITTPEKDHNINIREHELELFIGPNDYSTLEHAWELLDREIKKI